MVCMCVCVCVYLYMYTVQSECFTIDSTSPFYYSILCVYMYVHSMYTYTCFEFLWCTRIVVSSDKGYVVTSINSHPRHCQHRQTKNYKGIDITMLKPLTLFFLSLSFSFLFLFLFKLPVCDLIYKRIKKFFE